MRYPTTDTITRDGHTILAEYKPIPECVVKGCGMQRGRQLPVCTLHHPSVTMRTPEQQTALDRRRMRRRIQALIVSAKGNPALRTALAEVEKR